MTETAFIPVAGGSDKTEPDFWEPVIVRAKEIQDEADRLAADPIGPEGRRGVLIAHPRSEELGRGLAPGIEVRLSVLKPGEQTLPYRHNAAEVNFCIAGSGRTDVGDRVIDWGKYDVWNHPSWTSYVHRNDSDSPSVWFTYSNAALLRLLRVHMVDPEPPSPGEYVAAQDPEETELSPDLVSPYGTFGLSDDGAQLMPYEILISPPAVESMPLYWKWELVKAHLSKLSELGESYRGRRLYLLYNPMTGRTNGTTPNLFATMTIRPPGIVDRPHRHISAAINYYFSGSGYSRVAGKTYEWSSGDLMLSAPGWAIHNHASDKNESVYELTVQDQPMHIATESLLWQEDLKQSPILLGTSTGFMTNRKEVV